jgi:hypothetical protein
MNSLRAGLGGLSFMRPTAVEPTAVEPIVKAGTAEAPALTAPPTLLAIAGEVIE